MDYNYIQQLINNKKTVPEIAAELNLNKKYLYECLKNKNIKINNIPKTKNNYTKVLELNKQGKTIAEISENCNISKNTIRCYFFRNNIKINKQKIKLTGYSMFPLNEHKAYLLGIIYGDGSLNKDKKQTVIAMNDLDVLEKINKYVFDNKIKIRSNILKSGKKHYTLGVYSNYIWEDLKKFKLSNNKSQILEWPKLNKKLLPHFVRGLIDSDGSFFLEKNKKLVFAFGSCSQRFVEEFKSILIKYCKLNHTKTSIYKTQLKNKPFYLIRWNNKKDGLAIGEWVYKKADCKSERKYNIWNKYKKINTGDRW